MKNGAVDLMYCNPDFTFCLYCGYWFIFTLYSALSLFLFFGVAIKRVNGAQIKFIITALCPQSNDMKKPILHR